MYLILHMRKNKFCISQKSPYCRNLGKHLKCRIPRTQAFNVRFKVFKVSDVLHLYLKYSEFEGILITVPVRLFFKVSS